jgi:uncharacterized protein (TIGR03435 family)
MLRLVLVLCAAWPLAAQPVFDVATVKRGDGGRTVTGAVERGRFHARNTSLLALLCAAYQVPYFQITGCPSWVRSEVYDIEAKADATASTADTQVMLQALLTERFHLKIRHNHKEMTVLGLSQADGKGAKPTPADATGCEEDPLSPTNQCERLRMAAGYVLSAERISMPIFCKMLGSQFGQTIVDKTDLQGLYSFKVDLGGVGFPESQHDPI